MHNSLSGGPAPRPVRLGSFVVRIVECDGRVEYLVRDLRSGEERRFVDPCQLQSWLDEARARRRLR